MVMGGGPRGQTGSSLTYCCLPKFPVGSTRQSKHEKEKLPRLYHVADFGLARSFSCCGDNGADEMTATSSCCLPACQREFCPTHYASFTFARHVFKCSERLPGNICSSLHCLHGQSLIVCLGTRLAETILLSWTSNRGRPLQWWGGAVPHLPPMMSKCPKAFKFSPECPTVPLFD